MESSTLLLRSRKRPTVLIVLLAMLFVLIVSGAVAAYVAFPHVDQEIPGGRWLGETMQKTRELLPTLDEDEQRLLHR